MNFKVPIVTSLPGERIMVDGRSALNLATTNFLGLIETQRIKDIAIQAVLKYGVGSCGPRGFYGTIDVHLNLENKVAQFMGTEQAIIFSSGYATMSSVIPTFAGRPDILIVDKGVSHAIKTGVYLSRSVVYWFEHNDIKDLERALNKMLADDTKLKRPLSRRWVIIEGVYFNTGEIVPLPKILELKSKYCYRIILDDSYGVGVLGKTGRGTCEHHGVKVSDVDMVVADMGHSLASVGGFCAGSYAFIYHQRINASGYVFSASSPPYLVATAMEALNIIHESPELVARLQAKIARIRTGLSKISNLVIRGNKLSPVIHLSLAKSQESRLAEDTLLQKIVDLALENDIALTRAKYTADDPNPPAPSIRVCVSAAHKEDDIDKAVETIAKVVYSVLGSN